ncbi:MAG: DUF4445 domain-containing protein [Clostridia bacterium]|nr:DUF4445 domain-containing protein [Clostridia bacterium]
MIRVTIPEGHRGLSLALWLSQAGYSAILPCGGAGRCGNCRVSLLSGKLFDRDDPEKELTPDEGGEVRACRALLPDGETVVGIPDGWDAPGAGQAPRRYVTGALDLGTTTLALRLSDESGAVFETSAANPQCVYGADVASRITATAEKGVKEVQKVLLDRLSSLLSGCTVGRLSVVGNPTMIHIFAGVSPDPIGVSPFTPSFSDRKEFPGALLGLPVGTIVLLPSVKGAGYLGSDLVAGAFATGTLDFEEPTVYLDLGTNGELLLSTGSRNGGHLYAASCAVGPCFEGAGIGSGVGGIPGAVSRVVRREGEFVFATVDDLPPVGITGSGLIDLFALLLADGVIGRDGKLDEPFALVGRQAFADGTLSPACETPVRIEQRDVRALQTAKAAVRAGIAALLAAAWIDPDEVGTVLLAGSFGRYISPVSAAAIGLLPPGWSDEARAVGNAALEGADRWLSSDECRDGIERIAGSTIVVDLNSSPAFREAFLGGLDF